MQVFSQEHAEMKNEAQVSSQKYKKNENTEQKCRKLQTPARGVAVITGATHGIGRALALCFARAGYYLALNARDEAALQSLSEQIDQGQGECPRCVYAAGDISEMETAQRLLQAADGLAKTAGLPRSAGVLINNAGIAHIGLLQDMSAEDWNRIVSVNLTSVFNTCRAAIPYMLHAHSGRILNISSVWGVVGASCEVAYSAAKGGINAFSAALAKELAPSGIAVNALACGAVDTRMNGQLSEEERAQLLDEIPAGRMARPEEVAAFCLQLCEASTYLTGQTIRFDGGWI